MISGAINGDAWAVAGATSLLSNAIEYGYGSNNVEEFADRTYRNQDFWASTAADTIVGVATGAAAAGLVALGIAAIGVTTAPVWAVVGATALLAAGIGMGLNALGVNNAVQDVINLGIDWVESKIYHG